MVLGVVDQTAWSRTVNIELDRLELQRLGQARLDQPGQIWAKSGLDLPSNGTHSGLVR